VSAPNNPSTWEMVAVREAADAFEAAREARDLAVVMAARAGWSLRVIGAAAGVSHATVATIVAKEAGR
jgi:hypothetical protein